MASPTPNWFAFNNHTVNTSVPPVNGPNITFNDTWTDAESIPDMIQHGETLSGFTAVFNTVSVPTRVTFNAAPDDFTGGGAVYSGSDYFGLADNTIFVGTASAVPEPSTIILLGAGIAGVGLIRRRLKKQP